MTQYHTVNSRPKPSRAPPPPPPPPRDELLPTYYAYLDDAELQHPLGNPNPNPNQVGAHLDDAELCTYFAAYVLTMRTLTTPSCSTFSMERRAAGSRSSSVLTWLGLGLGLG